MILLGLLVAGVAGYAAWKGKFSEDHSATIDLIVETVKRASLDISITERGSLESANNMVLTSKVEGDAGTNIIMIVEEGTAVKEGDLLVELDSAKLRTDELQQRIVLTNAKAVMDQALKNVEIQKTQNESDIAAADLAKMLAELDLEKYHKGDYVLESKLVEGEKRLANEEYLRARDKYAYTARLIKKGYATQTELEADRIAVEKAKVALQSAAAKDDVLQKYTKTRMLEEKKANNKETILQLERVRLKAEAALAQYVSDYNSKKLTYESEETKYKKMIEQLEQCKIKAPRDGMVVYANSRSGGRGSSEGPLIYEGARVKERQAIIQLPDVTQMRVNARIHESKIAMVIEGLPATIRCDAEPGEIFRGEVDMVSLVPASGSWPNYNLKEYVTFVKLTDDTSKISKLKPGLTAEVEILIDRLVDVLQAPLQSFVERGGRHFAWIVREGKIERHEVKLGKASEAMQQILEDESLYAQNQGLKEGDSVVLNPRTVLPKEVVALEEEIAPLVQGPAIEGKLPPESPGAVGPGDASPGRRGEAGGGEGDGGRKKGAGGGGDPSAAFARFDADSNGKLSEDELPPPLRGSFAVLDANGDKSIDKEEWQKGAASMSRGGGGGSASKGEGKTAGAGEPVAGG